MSLHCREPAESQALRAMLLRPSHTRTLCISRSLCCVSPQPLAGGHRRDEPCKDFTCGRQENLHLPSCCLPAFSVQSSVLRQRYCTKLRAQRAYSEFVCSKV